MASSTTTFISELVRAANKIDRLTKPERVRLMQRAAATIQNMREEIALSGGPANDNDPDDLVFELREWAKWPEIYLGAEMAAKLLEGAEAIRACKIQLGTKDETLRGGPQPTGFSLAGSSFRATFFSGRKE